VFRCIFYVLPVVVCLVLIFFNAFQYYIGGELAGTSGEDTQKLAALQFAAKVHELLMIASLVSILIAIIREELSVKDGLPFGALFSPQQIQSIDILWSPELWGSLKGAFQARSARWIMITIITIIFAILALTVGPSSANLMKPRLQDWDAGGTPFWIQGVESVLFPGTIYDDPGFTQCTVSDADPSCPSEGWQIINEQIWSLGPTSEGLSMNPESIQLDSRNSIREVNFRTRTTYSTMFSNAWTISSLPMVFIADTVSELAKSWYSEAKNEHSFRLRFRVDTKHSVNALEPIVLARCTASDITNNTFQVQFPVLSSIYLLDGKSGDNSRSEFTYALNDTESGLAANVTSFVRGSLQASKPDVYWLDDSETLDILNATLAVAAFVPGDSSSEGTVYHCSLDSRFRNETTWVLRSNVKIAHSTSHPGDGTINTPFPKVFPTKAWASYLNPTIEGTNSSVFATLTKSAGIWTDQLAAPEDNEVVVEQIFSLLLSNGISRLNYNYTPAGTPKDDFGRQLLPINGRINVGNVSYDISSDEENMATKFQMEATITGYAYSYKGKVQEACLGVLAVYSIVIMICILYVTLYNHHQSTPWGRPSEIAALAINSRKTRELHNTGAGIATVSVFEKTVSIKDHDGNLRMVFGESSKDAVVENDQKYG
jgi:hypothetical protein